MYIEIILIECELKLIETDLSAVLSNRNSGSLHMEGEGRKGISERGGGDWCHFQNNSNVIGKVARDKELDYQMFSD